MSKVKNLRTIRLLLAAMLLCVRPLCVRSEVIRLTMAEVISMAQESSPQAVQARNSFESAQLSYKSYKAQYLPSLSLSSNPSLNRSTNSMTLPDGSEKYVRSNSVHSGLSLDLSQNIWFTGGTISLSSSVSRLDQFGDSRTHNYYTQPLQITISQSLDGYNPFKWERKTEPLSYRMARKQYAETLELVASQASLLFFELVSAQTNMEIANLNYAAADTLYTFGRGRYDIGTITENELLQLELRLLNEETGIISSRAGLDDATDALRNYLNLPSDIDIQVITDDSIPHFTIPVSEALELAERNSPDIDAMELNRISSESNLAYSKSQTGFRASIYMRLGLAQTADELPESLRNLNDEQVVSVSVSIPILDWGRGRGRVRIAQNNLELTQLRNQQSRVSFEKTITRAVSQFNIQERQVDIARRTMQTAQHRYDVAHHMYMTGHSTMLELNEAITAKDSAYRGYISALSRYWQLYYTIRSITGYDFENDTLIEYQIEDGL